MDIGRAEYYAVTDAEALEAFQHVSTLEGIIPALETSHAFAYLKVRLRAKFYVGTPGRREINGCIRNLLSCFLWTPSRGNHDGSDALLSSTSQRSSCRGLYAGLACDKRRVYAEALSECDRVVHGIGTASAPCQQPWVHDVTGCFTVFPTPQELCARLPDGSRIVINCSGRGDKDINTAMKLMQGISQDEPQQ